MDNISEEFNKQVNGAFRVIDSSRVFSTVLGLFLALYASLAAPALPKSITNIFKSTWFRLIFMFMIAYISTKNPSIAIISAVALLVTLQTLHAQETTNTILTSVEQKMVDNFENFDDVQGTPSTDDFDTISEYESVSSEETTDLLTSDDLLNTKEKVNKSHKVEPPKEIIVEIPTRNEIHNIQMEKPINSEIINISIPNESLRVSNVSLPSVSSESINIPMAMHFEKPKNGENVTIFIPSENNNLNNIKLNSNRRVVFASAEEENKKNKVYININDEINKDDDDDEDEEETKQTKQTKEDKEDDNETDLLDLVLGFENVESFAPIKNTNLGVTKSCSTNKCFTKKEYFDNSEANGSCKDILSTVPGFEDNEFASF